MRRFPFLAAVLTGILILLAVGAWAQPAADQVRTDVLADTLLSQETTAAEQAASEPTVIKGSWAALPDGIQLLIVFFGIIILYLIFSSVIARKRDSTEEIVYQKDAPETAGTIVRNDEGRLPRRPLPSTPRRDPSPTPESPAGRTRKSSKGGFIPLVFFAILIINLLKECTRAN